ncbi:AAA domain-containing protein [Dysgonomonas sp. 25]|uniref:AAA domain-containing protein n=1 Tax=Dysgonomonas sp. 25 TaxID=2302933 RepID=UPI0013D01D56|nr:AAA domain-containing protein [Dysgonomonas sp. 25]NDV69957.1 hypothetical protein [Dysgonomonas sp. 25]
MLTEKEAKTDLSRKWIDYYAASLTDGDVYDIQPKEYSNGCIVNDINVLTTDYLQVIYKDFYEKTQKKKEKADNTDENLYPDIDIFLSPFLMSKEIERGKSTNKNDFFPFWIPAKLTEKGVLLAPGENAVPWFLRKILEPNAVNYLDMPCIAHITDVLNQINTFNFNTDTWETYFADCEALFEKITGYTFKKFKIGNAVIVQQVCLIPAKTKIKANSIQEVYTYLKSTKRIPGLLHLILNGQDVDQNDLPPEDVLFTTKGHYGQYNNKFSLSYSQRQSLLAFVKDKTECKSSVSAVNGPPGTGKTTLLQSIIANEVVNAVLVGKDAPLIAATSANNQAITNILDSFGNTKNLHRWLPGISSLGTYLVPASEDKQEAASKKGYQTLTSGIKGLEGYYFNSLENLDVPIEDLERFYVDNFKKANKITLPYSVSEVVDTLRCEIKDLTEEIDYILNTADFVKKAEIKYLPLSQMENLQNEISELKQELDERTAKEKEFFVFKKEFDTFFRENRLSIIKKLFSSKKQAYANKVKLFLSTARYSELKELSTQEEAEIILLKIIEKIHNSIDTIKKPLQEKKNIYQKLSEIKIEYDKINELTDSLWTDFLKTIKSAEDLDRYKSGIRSVSYIEKINIILDLTLRYSCFISALHYWEGRWLILRQESDLKNGRGKDSRKDVFRRISYLTPLFVSTLHTLPTFCSYRKKEDEWLNKPILEMFDILIVDEAGQVTPEIGIASMGFAKRAVIVGDIHQIEPIWNIDYPRVDKGNLIEAGLLRNQTFEELSDRGMLCTCGSLMHLSRNSSRYRVNRDMGGTILTEHRRCVDKLVAFSNEYVYKGLLKPLTGDIEYNIFKDGNEKLLVRPLSYINVRGHSMTGSGSTYNIEEAEAIAKWINKYEKYILNFYREKEKKKELSLKDCIAIVTPFSEQKREIYRAFRRYNIDPDITVGTVHALQGAEIPIVIFSPAYGINHEGKPLFFDNGYNMLNVALTRAKEHFIVIGNMKLFNPLAVNKPSGGLGKYLFEQEANELPSAYLLEDVNTESSQRVDTLEKHQKCLVRAFEKANRRIVIVSPFISAHALMADDLLTQIKKCVSRNVEVIIYTDNNLDKVNGKLKDSSKKGRQLLLEAGAILKILNGIHNKALAIDEDILIEGSFNWLSAVRDKNNPHFRLEVSQIILKEEAKQQIVQLLKELDRNSQ